jgi:hypothetical protein
MQDRKRPTPRTGCMRCKQGTNPYPQPRGLLASLLCHHTGTLRSSFSLSLPNTRVHTYAHTSPRPPPLALQAAHRDWSFLCCIVQLRHRPEARSVYRHSQSTPVQCLLLQWYLCHVRAPLLLPPPPPPPLALSLSFFHTPGTRLGSRLGVGSGGGWMAWTLPPRHTGCNV